MKQIKAVYLTTIDNPFNPSTQWDEWRRFDEDHHYFTSQYLARLAKTSTELSDEDNLIEIHQTINAICELNPLGLYKKLIIYEDQVANEPQTEEGEGVTPQLDPPIASLPS